MKLNCSLTFKRFLETQYRLLVCAHPVLGKVEFEVLDTDDEVIYNSDDEVENETTCSTSK